MSTSNASPNTLPRSLAGPPGDCCVRGSKYDGTPVGHRETIAGVDTYVVDPPPACAQGPKKVLLYFSDIFGAFYINSQLLQDRYASQGFRVLGIDYLFGDYVQNHPEFLPNPAGNPVASADLTQWVEQRHVAAQEATPKWVDAVRDLHGPDALYFCVGYCFGGPFVMDLAATDKVAAAAFAQPTGLNEDHFKALKKPLLLSCAEIDPLFSADARYKAEAILADIKATYYIQVFSGVEHGFATRGDITQENIRWARETSAQSIVNWFYRFGVA